MLIIPIKDGENIDRALKRFKRKFDRTGAMRQLRERKLLQNLLSHAVLWFKKRNTSKNFATQRKSKTPIKE
jgi:ribosomal protein S21